MPLAMLKFITVVMAKTWNSGSTPSIRSRSVTWRFCQDLNLTDIDRQIGMGEHRRFGRSGGAAGILQHGDRVGRDRGPLVPAVIGQQRRHCARSCR